ncbi:PP2C family protein-serine/threonine phosphatase [Pseudarthrobacter albicanus]|uniref:PP2C family protein-serine/threonine phosphatase n=1 Tax=Pseudarthrobacter albicanus TaxID=2823873 RepID=UPI001BA87CBD|nr:GAF domain-containing SpoIIE family protein phosphatase [Pseudarthrobacter albicanus]
MNVHLKPAGEAERDRLVSLHSLSLMDTRDSERLFVKSPQGTVRTEMDRKDTFCAATIAQPDILMVPDATADPRFAALPDVVGGRRVRFYAGRPLSVDAGSRVGTLCLFDTQPRHLSEDQLRQLDELGSWAERELQDSGGRDRARAVEQALLPSTLPGAPHYEVSAICLPRGDVGEDFYSWSESEGIVDLILADVMGKGTAAALMAATVRSAVRSAGGNRPAAVLDRASELLAQDLESTATFATAFLARLELATGRLEYADAGHGLSIIVAADGSYRRLHGHGLPLGIGEPGSWHTEHAVLAPGETLASFTDGLLDLYDGTLAALDDVAALIRHCNPAGITTLLQDLHRGTQPDDDVTAIFLTRLHASA